MLRHNFEMSRHKLLFCLYCVATVLFSSRRFSSTYVATQLPGVVTNIFAFSSSLCRNINYCAMTFFLWFFSTFVATIISHVVTEFLSTVCCCYRGIKLLYRDILLLPCNANSDFMSQHTLKMSQHISFLDLCHLLNYLSQHKKPLSRPTCLDLSHCSTIFCHDIVFVCHDILLQELLNQYRDIKIHCRDKVLYSDYNYVATFTSSLQHFLFNLSHFVS